jgi:hypothetical protein
MFTIKKYEPDEIICQNLKAPSNAPSWIILYNGQIFYTSTLAGKTIELYAQEATAQQQCDFLNQYGEPIKEN